MTGKPDLLKSIDRIQHICAVCANACALYARRARGHIFFTSMHAKNRVFDYVDSALLPSMIARRGWLVRLMGWPMRLANVKLLMNVAPGLGHNTVELDLFFRLQKSGEVPAGARVAFVRKASQIHRDTLSLYRKRFWYSSASSLIYYLFYLPAAASPDLHVDCGLSRLKWHYEPERKLERPADGQAYLHQISKAENRDAWRRYYAIRLQNPDYFPLREGIHPDRQLLEFLNNSAGKKIALIHIKNHVANATAAPTDANEYIAAIKWLQEQGYLVVQAGREPLPPQFEALGVLNYAEFSDATYRHDLQLFALASIAITAGSGIGTLADCMGTPLVYLDSWHLGMPMAAATSVMVPALVQEVATGRFLSLKEQFDLYLALDDVGDEIFPADRYRGRNATSDEILAAVQEVIDFTSRKVDLTDRQKAFTRIDEDGLISISQSRVSDYFLRKHEELLDSGDRPARCSGQSVSEEDARS